MPFYRSKIKSSGDSDLSFTVCYIKNGDTIPFKSCVSSAYTNNSKFNTVVNIGDNVAGCMNLYLNTGINQSVVFSDSVTNCHGTFMNCRYFNKPIIIPNSVEDCSNMFRGCNNLNSLISLASSAKNCSNMFSYCTRFNSPINFPNDAVVEDCYGMFNFCNLFNQPVIIPNTAKNLSYMFNHCNRLNSEVVIPSTALDCSNMFCQCTNFNQPVTIPDNANCASMFLVCSNFNQQIILPKNVTHAEGMLQQAYNMSSNIYINGNPNTSAMLSSRYTNKRINVHVTSLFNQNMQIICNSPANALILTPMSDGNGYYNTAYNFYIYNNYIAT